MLTLRRQRLGEHNNKRKVLEEGCGLNVCLAALGGSLNTDSQAPPLSSQVRNSGSTTIGVRRH